ncbi:MAG: CAP domain-containing protein [Clostridiales bacterium]|nr:CAP domain-containing protein [Clostridiales bacterium]
MKKTKRGKELLGFLLALVFMIFLKPSDVFASDTAMIYIETTYGQEEARSMLDDINAFRTGDDAWYWNEDDETKTYCTDLGELTYDYDLEAIAQQRAEEIAVYFAHTRPNGDTCFSLTNDNSSNGENIAAGYTTADAVLTGWKEEEENYSGQGHRRNMLNSSYVSVGIGHVTFNGYDFWVQEFGTKVTAEYTTMEITDGPVTSEIEVLLDYISDIDFSPDTCEVEVGSTVDLPEANMTLQLAETWPGRKFSAETDYTWTADDEYISIQDDKIYGLKTGTGTLSTTILGYSCTATVSVVCTHTYDDGAATTEATCTEDGVKTYTCTKCGDSYTEAIAATGHSHDSGIVTTEATCIEEGVITYTCVKCGISYTEVIAATGHAYDEGVVKKAATYTSTGTRTYTCSACGYSYTETIAKLTAPKVGTKATVGDISYKITKAGVTGGTVAVTGIKASATKVTIPATVTMNGITYKVTSIADNALKNHKKVTKIVIGKNITTIGKNAFYGCKKLKNITIKTTKLTKKKVGAKAFKGIRAKAKIKVPKAKLKAYKKILKAKGLGTKATVK